MLSIEQLFGTLKTGSGFWNPIAWIIVIIIALLLVYIIHGIGKKEEKKKIRKIQSIPIADEEYEKERKHMKDCNLYWDFVESISGVLKNLDELHKGNLKDYIMWYIIVTAILMLLLVVI